MDEVQKDYMKNGDSHSSNSNNSLLATTRTADNGHHGNMHLQQTKTTTMETSDDTQQQQRSMYPTSSSQAAANAKREIRALENELNSLARALQSYPKNGKSWQLLQSYFDRVQHELNIVRRDIEVLHRRHILLHIMIPDGDVNLGLVIDKHPMKNGGHVYVRCMHPLSPLRDVLHVQDKIIAIDDEDVQELSANDVGKLLLGSSGSSKNKRRKRMMTVIREQRDDDIFVVGTSYDALSGYDDNDMTDNNVKHSDQPGTFISQQKKIQAISNEEEHEVFANNGPSNNNSQIDNDVATLENVACKISNANNRQHDPKDGSILVNDLAVNPHPHPPPLFSQ